VSAHHSHVTRWGNLSLSLFSHKGRTYEEESDAGVADGDGPSGSRGERLGPLAAEEGRLQVVPQVEGRAQRAIEQDLVPALTPPTLCEPNCSVRRWSSRGERTRC
jgi:hypothetical protein